MIGENEALIEYDGTSMPLSSAEKLKAAKWGSLFRLSSGSLWKIKSETVGGIAVYICTCDDMTLYIDAATKIPLKIISGETVIDVLSCQ